MVCDLSVFAMKTGFERKMSEKSNKSKKSVQSFAVVSPQKGIRKGKRGGDEDEDGVKARKKRLAIESSESDESGLSSVESESEGGGGGLVLGNQLNVAGLKYSRFTRALSHGSVGRFTLKSADYFDPASGFHRIEKWMKQKAAIMNQANQDVRCLGDETVSLRRSELVAIQEADDGEAVDQALLDDPDDAVVEDGPVVEVSQVMVELFSEHQLALQVGVVFNAEHLSGTELKFSMFAVTDTWIDQRRGNIGTYQGHSSRNRNNVSEFNAARVYNKQFWSGHVQVLNKRGGGVFRVLELAVKIPMGFLTDKARTNHIHSMEELKSQKKLTLDGRWMKLALFNDYATIHNKFQDSSLVIRAKKFGYKPVFLFKNIMYNKSCDRYGAGGHRLESCDRFGKSFISLVGFIKEHDVTGLQFSAVSILKDDMPLTSRLMPELDEVSTERAEPAVPQIEE